MAISIRNAAALAITTVALAAVACSSGSDGDTVVVNLTGVRPLENGFFYEGWALINGIPVSTGKFNATADGTLIQPDGKAVKGNEFRADGDLAGASTFMVSIEPAGDTDPSPSDTRFLAGDVVDGSATLTVGDPSAVGESYESANGFYILATPTDGHLRTNEKAGIWFRRAIDQLEPDPRGLYMPLAPKGWLYEGFVVIDGVPVTTGKFYDPWDIDQAAPYSGPIDMNSKDIKDVMFDDYVSVVVQGEDGTKLVTGAEGWKMFQQDGLNLNLFFHGPPEPGEDFLLNAPPGLTFPVDLTGMPIMVTLEPVPDDSPAPFNLDVLRGTVPENAVSHNTYILNPDFMDFPSGTVTFK